MKLGIIVHVVPKSNIFIVDIGWGQLRYFYADRDCKIGDVILYEQDYYDSVDSNEIKCIYRLDDCDYQGNIRFDVYRPSSSESDIVIAKRDFFVYWKADKSEKQVYWGRMETFDKTSNSLLFLSYANPRYPSPDEKEFLKAYTDARIKVEELNIPKMIEELKVEVYNNDWTRRGSDNAMFCHKGLRYNYSYHYDYLHDHYLDSIFPKYSENLYSSEDGECIHSS